SRTGLASRPAQPFRGNRCSRNMANLEAWRPTMPHAAESGIEELFRARVLERVRLAGLLGADAREDIAQEAFTRLMNRRREEPQAAVGYLRTIVCNLTRNRH